MPCPNCGGPTRPGAKFCGTCGAPLATTTAFAPTFVTYADSGPLADDPFTPLPPPMRPAAAGASPPVAAPAGVDAPPVAVASGGSWLPATVPSYRRKAWIALGLYVLLWLPGMVANLVWWRETVVAERYTGVKPDGAGCLLWLLGVCGVGGLLLLVVLGRAGGATP